MCVANNMNKPPTAENVRPSVQGTAAERRKIFSVIPEAQVPLKERVAQERERLLGLTASQDPAAVLVKAHSLRFQGKI